MSYDAEKLELIRWLMDLEDKAAISYLKVVKESMESTTDWGNTISEEARSGIMSGLEDVANNRVTPHTEVKKVYGL
jgi:hypothetical protein